VNENERLVAPHYQGAHGTCGRLDDEMKQLGDEQFSVRVPRIVRNGNSRRVKKERKLL
jgi:hypothetical protein